MPFWTNGMVVTFLSVLLVAAIMATFEVVFFVVQVNPQVKGNIQGMLPRPPAGTAAIQNNPLRVLLRLLEVREGEQLAAHNRSAIGFGSVIAITPLLMALGLWASHRRSLTRSDAKEVVFNVAFVVGILILFQLWFYQVGRRYRYSSRTELIHAVAKDYLEKTGTVTSAADLERRLQQAGVDDDVSDADLMVAIERVRLQQ